MLNYKKNRLPSLPLVAHKILALNMDNEHDQEALVPAICQCPVTTTRIIALANSVAYGVPGCTITSVKEAAQRLGLKKIYGIALASAMFTMGNQAGKNRLDREQLWAHNALIIKVMLAIAAYMPTAIRPSEADIALAGLLHDIGLIVYDALEPADTQRFIVELRKDPSNLRTLSMDIFGITHEDLGAEVLASWSIPANIVEAVRHHHDIHAKHSMLSRLPVATEEILQSSSAFGHAKDEKVISFVDVARVLGIKIEQVKLMVNEFRKRGLPVICGESLSFDNPKRIKSDLGNEKLSDNFASGGLRTLYVSR